MLLVQKYLENKTFGDLAREHGVYASFSKSGHKFSLNYDQIEAKESDPLAQECRGLILALEDGSPIIATGTTGFATRDATCPGKTKILAYPMKRFFNYGQGCAAQIDWSDKQLAVLEKLDGTLCIVYWDSVIDNWCVATRSVPEADLLMDNGLYTFRTLFEKAVEETTQHTFVEFLDCLHPHFTYCFELTTPYNRIVVDYKNCGITLLAIRYLSNLKEIELHDSLGLGLAAIGVPIVQGHAYTTTEELVNWVSSLNPIDHEGVVVRDSKFNRIKIKNAAYVAYNKLHDRLGSSERNCMEFVLLEKDDDVAPFLAPEIGANMAKLKEGLAKSIHEHDLVYGVAKSFVDVAHPGSKKEFALAIQRAAAHAKTINRVIWTAPFFAMWDGKASSMKDFIQKNRKEGTWGDSFIDKLLEMSKQYST